MLFVRVCQRLNLMTGENYWLLPVLVHAVDAVIYVCVDA
jgi:hypothetical protein